MSFYDYKLSLRLGIEDPPFASLVMAAIRKADTDNLQRLKTAFPEIWIEFNRRYHAPNGELVGD